MKFWCGAGRNIFLPWTLWNAKVSRVIWVPHSGCCRRRERAFPLWWRVWLVAKWLVAWKCSSPRSWPFFQTNALDWWTPGSFAVFLRNNRIFWSQYWYPKLIKGIFLIIYSVLDPCLNLKFIVMLAIWSSINYEVNFLINVLHSNTTYALLARWSVLTYCRSGYTKLVLPKGASMH